VGGQANLARNYGLDGFVYNDCGLDQMAYDELAAETMTSAIHNQAQGIISFTQAGEFYNDRSLIQMADRIADWTIAQMQDREGYFYCTKGLLITNKIPYIRWGQAWMYLALATLLAHKIKYNGFRIDQP
jgi:N-acetyl-beta-hexosaminidase